MNILSFSWRDPKHPKAGGAEQVVHQHMKAWIAKGHKVTLFSSYFKGAKKTEKLDGVTIIRKGSPYLEVQLRGFIWYVFGKHEKFDLVIDQFHGIPFFTPLYIKVPIMAILQEVAGRVWLLNPLPFPINIILGRLAYYLEPILFVFYRRTPFMVGSSSAKKDLMKKGIPARKISVIPHGVITKPPRSMPKREEKKTVIFLGSLSKDKGIEDALECFKELSRSGDYKFWVIGKPESKDYLRYLHKLTRKLDLGKQVKFWGFVPQEQKFLLLSKAHVMINPSIHEGWGLVNIEANAMGTPVVAYPSQGLVDSVVNGKTGIICRESTPRSLAQQVEHIIKNKREYHIFQKNAVLWSKNFTWDKSTKLSCDLINWIAGVRR